VFYLFKRSSERSDKAIMPQSLPRRHLAQIREEYLGVARSINIAANADDTDLPSDSAHGKSVSILSNEAHERLLPDAYQPSERLLDPLISYYTNR
jgi:hypothetical protein